MSRPVRRAQPTATRRTAQHEHPVPPGPDTCGRYVGFERPPAISRLSVTSTGSPSFPPIRPASRDALGIPGGVLVTAMFYRIAERQGEILACYLWTIHEC